MERTFSENETRVSILNFEQHFSIHCIQDTHAFMNEIYLMKPAANEFHVPAGRRRHQGRPSEPLALVALPMEREYNGHS